ncbi:class I SAM-dependent methyltransferase [Clostridium sp. chh4-2]|uniref:class I SAM-dependent methyltransferase n=1 Tax=Clostridium sp. chh4-2 TaxID=2067550 RepID=UPI001FA93FE2|nr:class I SAM-dependent methyltransferase [Clostridium sp. chh4-2]
MNLDSIDYYNQYAAKVYEDTINQDMGEIMQQFLELLEEGDTILDLGCGSGRDSLTFYELGYDVTPLDAAEEMCKLAEIHTGLEVLQMTYEDMEFDDVFDGIWASASLIHTPKDEMIPLLDKLATSLKEDGILYMSFRKGELEGFSGKRFFSDYTKKELERLLENSGRFKTLKIWEDSHLFDEHRDITWIHVLAQKK